MSDKNSALSFDASKAVKPLNYDFKPYDPEAKGSVPEPTDDQVAEFYGHLAQQLERALGAERVAGVDLTDPVEVGGLFLSLDADDNRKVFEDLLDLHAAVCSDQPNREQIAALPFRLRRAWYGMVQGWLRPEA